MKKLRKTSRSESVTSNGFPPDQVRGDPPAGHSPSLDTSSSNRSDMLRACRRAAALRRALPCARRLGWVRGAIAALEEAQRHMDERCGAAVDRVSEEEFNRIFDEEQAKVCAILDQFAAIRERDEWPPEIYFGGN